MHRQKMLKINQGAGAYFTLPNTSTEGPLKRIPTQRYEIPFKILLKMLSNKYNQNVKSKT